MWRGYPDEGYNDSFWVKGLWCNQAFSTKPHTLGGFVLNAA